MSCGYWFRATRPCSPEKKDSAPTFQLRTFTPANQEDLLPVGFGYGSFELFAGFGPVALGRQ